MMNIKYVSSAENISAPLDCRQMSLVIYFYRLDEECVIHLCRELMQKAVEMGEDQLVYSWSYCHKNTTQKKIWTQLQQPIDPISGLSVFVEACVNSSVVHSLTSMRQYHRNYLIFHPVYSFGWDHNPGFGSIDYLAFNKSLFPGKLPPEEMVSKLHILFQERNRKCLSMHAPYDFFGSFHAEPYQNLPGLFYGKAAISFSAFCLGDALDTFAENLSDIAKQIAQRYVNINAQVRLQPQTNFESQYMRYFGKKAVTDGSHADANCSPKEWYTTYYLNSIEWLNIVSPVARQHLDKKQGAVLLDDSLVAEIPGGCLAVSSARHISEYDWAEAVKLKHILESALYRSGTRVPLRFVFPDPKFQGTELCPRNDWAIVPIEEGELYISGHELCYFNY